MKQKEIIIFIICTITIAILYFFTERYGEKTEKRVQEFIEQKKMESKNSE
tara:strand:+ start:107 stop:256 length:150 start_codon:yes stop_codon:yes gene_type:complete